MAAERIAGLGELLKTFSSLSSDMKKSGARRIAAAGGGVLRKGARNIAQSKGLRKTGAMIKNIAIKRERDAPEGTEQYNLGVRHGRDLGKKAVKYLEIGRRGRVVERYKNDPFYWYFLEFGRNIYAGAGNSARLSRGTKQQHATGRVQETPFLQPALENNRNQALAAMEKQALKEVQKAKK